MICSSQKKYYLFLSSLLRWRSFSLFILFIGFLAFGGFFCVKYASAYNPPLTETFDSLANGTRVHAIDQGWAWLTSDDDNTYVSDFDFLTSPNSAKTLDAGSRGFVKIFDDIGYWSGMSEINWTMPDLGHVQFNFKINYVNNSYTQYGLCRADGTPSSCVQSEFFLADEGVHAGYLSFRYNKNAGVVQDFASYSLDTWYQAKIGWDLTNQHIRYSFDGSEWSEWLDSPVLATDMPNAFYSHVEAGGATYLDNLVFVDDNYTEEPPPGEYCATTTAYYTFNKTIGYLGFYYSGLTASCFKDQTNCTINFGVGSIPMDYDEEEAYNAYFDIYAGDQKIGYSSLLLNRQYGRFNTIQVYTSIPTTTLTSLEIRIHDENLNRALCIPTSTTPVMEIALQAIETSMATSTEWCDQAELCAGISTTTNSWSIQGLMGGFNCWGRQMICWTFMPTPQSLGYLANSYDLASTRLPLSPFTTIWRDLNIMSTGTQAIDPGHIAVPFWDSSTQSYIGSTTDLSPVNMGYGWTKFRRLETIAMWMFLSVVPTIAFLIAIII